MGPMGLPLVEVFSTRIRGDASTDVPFQVADRLLVIDEQKYPMDPSTASEWILPPGRFESSAHDLSLPNSA